MGQKPNLEGVTRMSVADRVAAALVIATQLSQRFPGLRLGTLRSYRSKQDFSSLELLVAAPVEGPLRADLTQFFLQEVCTGASVVHDKRLALQYKEFKVDVLFVPPKHMDMTLAHLAYQELGELISKVAHAQGMSLSGEGLVYRVRDGVLMVADIELATTWESALELLGYSHSRWLEGFDGLDDVFAFVASSPLFMPSLFQLKAPAQPGARPTLRNAFAAWLEQKDLPEPAVALPWLYERVPGFEARYKEIVAADKKRKSKA